MLKVLLRFESFLAKMSLEFSECSEFKDKHQHYYHYLIILKMSDKFFKCDGTLCIQTKP